MDSNKSKHLIWVLFAVVLALRIILAFQTSYFSYDSYSHIRQVNSILETGKPVFEDKLSGGGKTFFFSPLFHYIFALLSLIAPLEIIGKIIPNILYALLIPLVYYISLKIANGPKPALFASVFAALFPALWQTINSLDPLCLAIPAIFYCFYCLLRVNEKKYLAPFILSGVFAAFLSPITLFIIPALWLFVLLLKIEKTEERNVVMEAIIFLSFLVILAQFLLYKKALLVQGYEIIWQNIPPQLLSNFFENITILGVIAAVGVVPFVFGVYEVYRTSFTKKEREISAIISLTIVFAFFLWLKLVKVHEGMLILGICLAIISAKVVDSVEAYTKKTKVNISFLHAALVILAVAALTSVPATISIIRNSAGDVPDKNEIDAMLWLRENSSESAVVAASTKEGFLINAVALRKNIIDNNFLMVANPGTRYSDVAEIYQTNFETEAVGLLNKYRSKYILLSKNTLREFNSSDLRYADIKCFEKFYENNETEIYKTWCDVE